MEAMYEGVAGSPLTTLTSAIGAADTVIAVDDVNVFPAAPNYATIQGDDVFETILYTAKTATALSGCTRAVEGTAQEWDTGDVISRNWTAKDHKALIDNINEVSDQADRYLGYFASLSELQTEYPTAYTDEFANVAGKLYVWNGSTWVGAGAGTADISGKLMLTDGAEKYAVAASVVGGALALTYTEIE